MAVRGAPIRLDWRAVGRGVAAYLILAVPSAALIALTHGGDTTGQESNFWVVAAVIVIFVAPFVGGLAAGRAQPRAPLSHAAAAVGLPFTAYLLIRIVDGAIRGTLTASIVATLVLFLMVFTGIAVIGGYVAFRRHARG